MTGTQILWRRWAPEILLALAAGPRRFNGLLSLRLAATDWLISDRILTVRLRELEDLGLVVRRVEAKPYSAVKVFYSLTETGQRYVPGLSALREVAAKAS